VVFDLLVLPRYSQAHHQALHYFLAETNALMEEAVHQKEGHQSEKASHLTY